MGGPVLDSAALPRVVLGVSGGIAAYKAVEVCRRLVDAGVHVMPVLTEGAQQFVGPLTFSALASQPAQTELFGTADPIPHTTLGQTADLVLVAPATAHLLGRYSAGLADDLLTATLLATRAPVIVAPAMHTEMWEHPATRSNIATLVGRGVQVIEPESGRLAGGDLGAGRLAEPDTIVAAALATIGNAGSLAGRRVLVTAGGTREAIDPVRYVGNRSSGKMGHALATAAAQRGAEVVLVTTSKLPAPGCNERIAVESAQELRDAVVSRFDSADVVIMAAAVADFRPKVVAHQKLKKLDGPPDIVLEPTPDILAELGALAGSQILVGFAAETGRLVENAAAKLKAKNVDLLVANDVSERDAGFEVDTNRAVLLDRSGATEHLELMSKIALAGVVCDRIVELMAAGT